MAINRPPLSRPLGSSLLSPPQPPTPEDTPIEGDPATQRFGFVFLGALAVVTVAVIIGIGVGNIAHYRYFGPYPRPVFNFSAIYNATLT